MFTSFCTLPVLPFLPPRQFYHFSATGGFIILEVALFFGAARFNASPFCYRIYHFAIRIIFGPVGFSVFDIFCPMSVLLFYHFTNFAALSRLLFLTHLSFVSISGPVCINICFHFRPLPALEFYQISRFYHPLQAFHFIIRTALRPSRFYCFNVFAPYRFYHFAIFTNLILRRTWWLSHLPVVSLVGTAGFSVFTDPL